MPLLFYSSALPPTANSIAVNVPFNTATSVPLTGGDPNVPPLSLIYTIVSGPAHGALTGTAPNLTYTPVSNFNGSDSFQFIVTNSVNSNSSPGTATLTVAPGVPTANSQSVNVAFNAGTQLSLVGNDPNDPPLPLTYIISTNPSHGSLSGSGPVVTYTPTSGYSGSDLFQFTVKNSGNKTSAAAPIHSILLREHPRRRDNRPTSPLILPHRLRFREPTRIIQRWP